MLKIYSLFSLPVGIKYKTKLKDFTKKNKGQKKKPPLFSILYTHGIQVTSNEAI